MTGPKRLYHCGHCAEVFTNPVKLGGHVHAVHPEHRRAAPLWLRTEKAKREQRPSLKRATDTWPARA